VISKKEIAAICLNGVAAAAKKYKKWSGGVSLRSAPENFTHIILAEYLANKLGKNCTWSKLITLEEKPKDLIQASGCPIKIKMSRRIERGRIDISVWDKKEMPWLIIEVKRHSGHKSINDDVKRIRTLFKGCPSIKAGFIVVVTQANEAETLRKRFGMMAKESKTKKEGISFLNGMTTKKGIARQTCAMCFVVNRGENTP